MCGCVGFSEIIQGSYIAIYQNQWPLHGPRPRALSHHGMNGALQCVVCSYVVCSKDTQSDNFPVCRVMSDLNSTLHEELFPQPGNDTALTNQSPVVWSRDSPLTNQKSGYCHARTCHDTHRAGPSPLTRVWCLYFESSWSLDHRDSDFNGISYIALYYCSKTNWYFL